MRSLFQNMTAEKAMGRIEQLEQKDMLRQMERENSEMITRIQALYDAGSMEEFQEQYAQFKEGAKDRLHAALSPTETRLSDSLRGMLSFYNHYPEKQVFMRTTSSDPTLSIFANMVARRMMELEREYKVTFPKGMFFLEIDLVSRWPPCTWKPSSCTCPGWMRSVSPMACISTFWRPVPPPRANPSCSN